MMAESPNHVENTWYYTALAEADHKCQNCGSDDSVSAKLLVPEEVGGQRTAANSTVLCKTCRFLSEKPLKGTQLPTSFFVSHRLYARLNEYCKRAKTSISNVIRSRITHFTGIPVDAFETIWAYQETDKDVKLNVQVDLEYYTEFKRILADERRTVQEAMVALLNDYLEAMESVNV